MILRFRDEPTLQYRPLCEWEMGGGEGAADERTLYLDETTNQPLVEDIRARSGAYALDAKGALWQDANWEGAEPEAPAPKPLPPKWVACAVAPPRDLRAEIEAASDFDGLKQAVLGVFDRHEASLSANDARGMKR